MKCPDCGHVFSAEGYAIHRGMKHRPRKCSYRGDNRGWCVTHDAPWRVDRRVCEAE